MLRLFLNSKVFWSANEAECPTPEYAIFSLKTSHRIDDIDSMTFTMLRTHPMFNQIIEKRSTFLLCDSEVLFLGKVVNIESSYDFKVDITCEEWLGCTKDDYWGPYFLDLTAAQRTKYDTVDEIIDYTINHLNRTKDAYCGVNTDWPNFPKVKKGYYNYTGEAKEVQEFDLGCKTLYDVMFNEVISKCGGFWRTRVIGEYEKVDNVVVGFKLQKVLLDFLSTDSDFDIDPETGAIIDEYEIPPEDFGEYDAGDDGTLIHEEEVVPAEESNSSQSKAITGLPNDRTTIYNVENFYTDVYPSVQIQGPIEYDEEDEDGNVVHHIAEAPEVQSVELICTNMETSDYVWVENEDHERVLEQIDEPCIIDLLSRDSEGSLYYKYYGVRVSVFGTDANKLIDDKGYLKDITLIAVNEDDEYIYTKVFIGINRYSVDIKPESLGEGILSYNTVNYKYKSNINSDTYIRFETIIKANN